ncbi:hypothetical protein L1987_23024 [Smallanthus sonchifolius]|uniref:Uncharacterized protein n=1 Tax=Smallanthus sonchifolius TaxID=185202 RepID=A0ACB9IJ50_9ASTR|nr:hypothetical protein L1987_23024 [Smallanthus sonchifolius]
MIRMVRRGSRKVWWLIPCARKTPSRTKSKSDTYEIHGTELATIDEDSEMYEQQDNRAEKHQKRAKMGKTTKEELGRVFNTRFSVKNSYGLFLDMMTSTRSFGSIAFLSCALSLLSYIKLASSSLTSFSAKLHALHFEVPCTPPVQPFTELLQFLIGPVFKSIIEKPFR